MTDSYSEQVGRIQKKFARKGLNVKHIKNFYRSLRKTTYFVWIKKVPLKASRVQRSHLWKVMNHEGTNVINGSTHCTAE